MANHSNILAWKILSTAEPGGLQSMMSKRAGHDLATEHACTCTIKLPMTLFIELEQIILKCNESIKDPELPKQY